MLDQRHLTYAEIESQVCDLTSERLGIPRHKVAPSSSLVEDLGCDSLELIDLLMALEEHFDVTLPENVPNPVYKSVFTRQPFRLAHLAELIYLQQGTGAPTRSRWLRTVVDPQVSRLAPFTHLDGRWDHYAASQRALLDRLPDDGPLPQYRRRSDGMRCVRLPPASVEIGCDSPGTPADEQPAHAVHLDAFLIDAEPVSTTAYCRFLNSVGDVPLEVLQDWFVLQPNDDRQAHALVTRTRGAWRPVPDTERWPMILVSWYGANAYSLWANGRNWRYYRDDLGAAHGSFLPSEAQWEYAARGARYQPFPWGDARAEPGRMRYGQHQRGTTYQAATLPIAAVNEPLGLSSFGLHHMAGNVWQWCRDWYDPEFYRRPEARLRNPLHRHATGVRSERGGSWIGSAELCRSSYRRGRPVLARGRCLGFRCVGLAEDA